MVVDARGQVGCHCHHCCRCVELPLLHPFPWVLEPKAVRALFVDTFALFSRQFVWTMALEVRQKFSPRLVLVHGWLFPVSVTQSYGIGPAQWPGSEVWSSLNSSCAAAERSKLHGGKSRERSM